MYNIGHTFIDDFYGLEFKIVTCYREYSMYRCETVHPNKDSHEMDLGLTCYFSENYVHSCDIGK